MQLPHSPAPARLRILHVILSRGFAGSERAAAEACNALARNHEVALVVRRDHRLRDGASIRDALEPGVTVFEVPAYWRTAHQLRELVSAWRPDVIHTHLRRGTRYVARLRSPAVHVCSVHLSLNGPHYLQADGLMCISPWQLSTVPRSYTGRVFLVPNSLMSHPKLDAGRLRQLRQELGVGEDDFVIGAVGRLVPRKGFDLLVRAFERAQLPGARLVIVGEGSERSRLQRLAGERVTFTGFRNDVKDLYQAFDLFVCPSSYEPFGRVIIEALDGGVHVIATDAEGPRDLAEHYPLEIVPRNDVEALATALQKAYGRGRKRVSVDLSEFGMQLTVDRMMRAYRELLAPQTEPAATGAAHATPRRFLFSPVSGPGGSGELMRCLIIARELARAEPSADIRFLVSKHAVFREAVNFPIIDCDASPTNSTPQVLAAIDSFRPHVMVFDNSGRTGQLRAAKRAGARLVFSSRAPKLRWKAFRIKWMRLLDEHWMVFPTFVVGGLNSLEKLKLRLFPHYEVRQLDTLFTPSQPGERADWLKRRGLEPGNYVVFAPGGRGEGTQVADPAELFIEAARQFVASTGCTSVVLTGRNSVATAGLPDALRLLPRIGPEEVQHLLADARIVVSNGGTTLIHSLAHGKPIVSVPLAGDQDRRIRKAARLEIAVRAPRDAEQIAAAAVALLQDGERREHMTRRIAELGFANGVTEAVGALRALARRAQV